MQPGRSPASRLTSALLALLIAASAIATSLPLTAHAARAHCPPAAPMPDCDHPRLDCCDTPPRETPALPDTSPAARPDLAKSASGLDAACGVAFVPPSALDGGRPLAPAQGYRCTDLVTLHSVLLI